MPDAPVQIIANGAGSTPAAPVQIAGNGSASAPSAPPNAASVPGRTTSGVLVGGVLSPNAAGFLQVVADDYFDRNLYANVNVDSREVPTTGLHIRVEYDGTRWVLAYYANGTTGGLTGSWQANTGTEATPDLASGWAPVSGGPSESGTPTMTLVTKAAPPLNVQPGGDAEESQPAAVLVSGTITPAEAAGLLIRAGTINGRNQYASDGRGTTGGATMTRLRWSGSLWQLQRYVGGVLQGSWHAALDVWDPTENPDGGEELPWTVVAGAVIPTGSPILARASAPPPQPAANGSGTTPAAPPAIV